MTDVLIRDLDDDVVDRLKVRAERNGRSLQAELKRLVEINARVSEEGFWKRVDDLAEAINEPGKTFTDSVELLREDRQR